MRLLALFSLVAALGASARAATTFTVDPARSTVTLSGTTVGNSPLTQQGPGSLTTRLEGSLEIEATAAQVSIPEGTIDARTNGVWAPGPGGAAGTAAADFGAQANSFFGPIIGALRNIEMTVVSPAQAVQNNQFDAAGIVFTFPTNSSAVLDYTAGITGPGSRALAGEATNRTATVATITGAAGARVLTIDVDATFEFSVAQDADTHLTIRGQIVAQEGDIVPPEAPQITSVKVVNNQVQITATGTTAGARLESSSNLTAWADKAATVTNPGGGTRVFTLPVPAPDEFYRIAQ